MKILGALHELRCTPSECYCERPMLVVDELRARATLDVRNGYNEIAKVELAHSRIVGGVPVVLNPLPGRRSASSRLSR